MSYRTSTETPRDFILTGYNDPHHPQYCPIGGRLLSLEFVKPDPQSTEPVIAPVLFELSPFPASEGCISGYARIPASRALQQVTSRYHTGEVQQGTMRTLVVELARDPFEDPTFRFSYDSADDFFGKTTSAFHRRMMEDIEALKEHSAGISRLESQMESAPQEELLTLGRELSQLKSETLSLEQYVHQSLQLTASAYQMLAQKIKKLSERLGLTVVDDGVLSPEDMALGKALIRKLAQYQTRLLFASSDCRLNFLQHRTEYVPPGSTNQGIGETNPNIPRWRNYFEHSWRQCVQKVEQAEEAMEKHQGTYQSQRGLDTFSQPSGGYPNFA